MPAGQIYRDNMKVAIYPGSFDPITNGHLDVARRAAVALVEVEVVCSDAAEHRRRVESRRADIPGLLLPTWDEVQAMQEFDADTIKETLDRIVQPSNAVLLIVGSTTTEAAKGLAEKYFGGWAGAAGRAHRSAQAVEPWFVACRTRQRRRPRTRSWQRR